MIDELYQTSSFEGRARLKQIMEYFEEYRSYKGCECKVDTTPEGNFELTISKGGHYIKAPISWLCFYNLTKEKVDVLVMETMKRFLL